jgi:hypothetical protein
MNKKEMILDYMRKVGPVSDVAIFTYGPILEEFPNCREFITTIQELIDEKKIKESSTDKDLLEVVE